MILDGAPKEAELLYLHEIVSSVKKHCKLRLDTIKICSKFLYGKKIAQKFSSSLEIVDSGYKRSITATFVVTLDGRFLPMQLIYDVKTDKSIPRVDFSREFSLSVNPKHFSNTDKSIKIINEILNPYFESQRKELGLDERFPVLLILDVFRIQMTHEVTLLLREKISFLSENGSVNG